MTERLQRAMDRILGMTPDPDKVKRKSFHYMGYIADHPCVVTELRGIPQEGRTTVEHISMTMGKRSPDFWTIPVSHGIHLSGNFSFETHGKKAVQEHFDLPEWEELALGYLIRYLVDGHHKRLISGYNGLLEADETEIHSAIHWAQELFEHI
jgi:hypothetical protein